jgi:hypothetical protein
LVACAACKGAGNVRCTKCRDGGFACLGKCIKRDLSRPGPVPGKGPGWIHVIAYRADGSSYQSYCHEVHLGELSVYDASGHIVARPKCPLCKGTSRMPCKACQGKANVSCTVCAGVKRVTPEANETWLRKRRAEQERDHVVLKNGERVAGIIMAVTATELMLRKPDGTMATIPLSEIAERPGQAAATPAAPAAAAQP